MSFIELTAHHYKTKITFNWDQVTVICPYLKKNNGEVVEMGTQITTTSGDYYWVEENYETVTDFLKTHH